MQKILLIATLISFNFSLLEAAKASLDQKYSQTLKNLELLKSELKNLETARTYYATQIKKSHIENPKLKAVKMEVMELILDLIELDKVDPLKTLCKTAKKTKTFLTQTLIPYDFSTNQITLMPVAAYTVYLNRKNCIPILQILENSGIDLTVPVIIKCQEAGSGFGLTNALEIARIQNNIPVLEFLSPDRNWSLEKAQKSWSFEEAQKHWFLEEAQKKIAALEAKKASTKAKTNELDDWYLEHLFQEPQ